MDSIFDRAHNGVGYFKMDFIRREMMR